MRHTTRVAELLAKARCILLDFDGPVCSVFAGVPAPTVADGLREILKRAGAPIPEPVASERDPMEILRYADTVGLPGLVAQVDNKLRNAEHHAIASACPTPGMAEFLETATRAGRRLAIVSNNSTPAIRAYLEDQRLSQWIGLVVGRRYAAPSRMKPSPAPLREAADELGMDVADCVLIGDTTTDVQAAHAAGMPCIGYANRPGKRDALTHDGADAVVNSVAELLEALNDATSAYGLPLSAFDGRSGDT